MSNGRKATIYTGKELADLETAARRSVATYERLRRVERNSERLAFYKGRASLGERILTILETVRYRER